MSNTCACCGSNMPQAIYDCFACGALRSQTPGLMGVCPRCQYRLMQGARWCPGCNLTADKIAFGAPLPPQQAAPETAAPHTAYAPPPAAPPSDSPPSYARPAVIYDQAPPQPRPPKPPKPPKPPRPPRPPKAESTGDDSAGASGGTRQNLIIAGVLGSAVALGMIFTVLQQGAQPPTLATTIGTATPGQSPGAPGAQPAPPIVVKPGTTTSAEARLLADPIDGLFFEEFRDRLPGDYQTVMGYLLVQVPDPARDMYRFEKLLGERLGVLRQSNASDIAGAEDSVLDEMADNMLFAMRAPEYCQASIDPAGGGLDPANTETRRLAAAINTSIVRAIASGRKHNIRREAPNRIQSTAFQNALKDRLYDHQWQAYRSGQMATLPPDEQCAIYVANWTLIAGFSPAVSASWTAEQMKQLAQ
jgi:hypothetical protein